MTDIDQNQDQDQGQDEESYQLTGDDLSELHTVARHLQAGGDPRAQKLWDVIAAQSGGGDGSGGPKFRVVQSPPAKSWVDDLENTLWGGSGSGRTGTQSIQGAGRDDDAGITSGSNSATEELPATDQAGEQQSQVTAQHTPDQMLTLLSQQQPRPAQPRGQTQQQQPTAQATTPGVDGRRVHFVAYTVGNPSGDEDFKKAAYTRASDIENAKSFDPQKDRVLVYGLQSKENLKWALQDAGSFGNIQELALFSHGGRNDGPIFHNAAGAEENLTNDEAAGLKINFTPSAHADFMACHTATNGFSENFANAHGVLALGFAGTTFSGEPNQKTYGYRSGDREYMLGSEGILNRTWHRVIGGDDLKGPQFFYPKEKDGSAGDGTKPK
jgi:hypothetical protein